MPISNWRKDVRDFISFSRISMNGTIKKIVALKGFGFISPEAGGDDVFFHCTKVVGGPSNFDLLQEGQKVTFEKVEGKKGFEANNIAPAEGAAA